MNFVEQKKIGCKEKYFCLISCLLLCPLLYQIMKWEENSSKIQLLRFWVTRRDYRCVVPSICTPTESPTSTLNSASLSSKVLGSPCLWAPGWGQFHQVRLGAPLPPLLFCHLLAVSSPWSSWCIWEVPCQSNEESFLNFSGHSSFLVAAWWAVFQISMLALLLWLCYHCVKV